jgi:predicted dehydrogenase
MYPEVEIVTDYKQLLNDPEIELVVISLPNTLHFPVAKACLEAGKHIIIEKPLVPTSAEADELISLSEATGKKIFVFQNRRWDGDFKTVKKVVSEGMLGKLLEYEAHFDRYTPVRKRAAWRDDPLPASGLLYDLGPHLIDQALVLFGKPESVYADIRSQRENSRVDDYFQLELHYQSMKAILKAGFFVREPGARYTLHGTLGSFVKYGIDPQESLLKQGFMPTGENWGKEESSFWGLLNTEREGTHFRGQIETETGNYHGFYQDVYHVLTTGGTPEVKPEEARTVIRVIELAFQSSQVKSIIPFSE